MTIKNLKEKYNLPDSVNVEIHKGETGEYYASLPDYPGCMTIGKTMGELIENITDAVFTYFEVSRKDALQSDIIYLPHVNKYEENKRVKSRVKEFISVSQQYFYA